MASTDGTLESTIADLWRRLGAIADRVGMPLQLNPGATEAQIAEVEAAIGQRFPADYRASLALHDGQAAFASGDVTSLPWLPGCPPLAPLAKIVEKWTELQELADEYPPPAHTEHGDRIKVGPYRKQIIPIAGTPWWDGDTTYLDLDPGPAGAVGQVITMVTECDFVALGATFEAALARWVEALESGAWVYAAAERAVHPAGGEPHAGHPAERFAGA